MSHLTMKTKLLALITALTAVACGRVQGPEYPGDPLATLQGQLTSAAPVETEHGIRLALAWYNHFGSGAGAPSGILTDELEYDAGFPIEYTFDVYQPPPAAALVDFSGEGGPRSAAIGLLLAYEDRSDNGALDPIPASGTAVDQVMGTSFDLLSGDGHILIYVAEAAPADAPAPWSQMQLGFNLVRMSEADGPSVVPLETPVHIRLEQDPSLNAYVCEARFDRNYVPTENPPCGVAFGEEQHQPYFGLSGSLLIDDAGAHVSLSLIDQGKVREDVISIRLDAHTLEKDEKGNFFLDGEVGALLIPGHTHVLEATAPGLNVVRQEVKMPGDFHITAPQTQEVQFSGQALIASWTEAASVPEYFVTLTNAETQAPVLSERSATTSFTSSAAVDFVGNAVLTVEAMIPPTNQVNARITRARALTFQAHP